MAPPSRPSATSLTMSLDISEQLRNLGVSDGMIEILSNPNVGGLTITGEQFLNWIGPTRNISNSEARALISEISSSGEREMTVEEYRQCVAAGVARDQITCAPVVSPMEFDIMDASDIMSSAVVHRPSRDVTTYEFNMEEIVSPRRSNNGNTQHD